MSKKWKIFGYQTNIEWYDIKTKIKQLIRKITYTLVFQEIISSIIKLYMWLVYLTSKKTIVNSDVMANSARTTEPLIILSWHNRLMMLPFVTLKIKKLNPKYQIMSLASNHGDGRFVGRIMEKFGATSVLGSTNDSRKSSRGISVASLRKILKGLKSGQVLGMTPDGPRGPNQKINGEIINIAKISGAKILTCSYSSSKMKQLRSWDKFKIPLPFGKLCIYFDKDLLKISKNDDDEKIKEILEKKLNQAQEQSLKNVK